MEFSAEALRAAAGSRWARVEVVAETGSTNADLLADTEAPDRSVRIALRQSAGRGRLERTWSAPPDSSLTFSVLLRPEPPLATWGWLPLLAGVALQEAVLADTGVAAGLKWPNDLLAGPDGGKLAGILAQTGAQTSGPAVVVGIGVNVTTAREDLPVPTAGSLTLAGATRPDRATLLVAILTRLDAWLDGWTAAGGDAEACGLAAAYRSVCLTIGQSVSVAAITGGTTTGTAAGVDSVGRLLVDTGTGTVAVGAGDVEHLRPA